MLLLAAALLFSLITRTETLVTIPSFFIKSRVVSRGGGLSRSFAATNAGPGKWGSIEHPNNDVLKLLALPGNGLKSTHMAQEPHQVLISEKTVTAEEKEKLEHSEDYDVNDTERVKPAKRDIIGERSKR